MGKLDPRRVDSPASGAPVAQAAAKALSSKREATGMLSKSAIESGLAKPKPCEVILDGIPQELKDRPQWVLWQFRRRNGRWTKIPISSTGSREAKSDDESTWDQFANIVRTYEEDRGGPGDGIGFVISSSDPYTGIDLDDAIDPETHQLKPWAQAIVAQLHSYTEVSPSGTGVKIWIKARKPSNARSRARHADGEVEIYDRGRYFAVTGQHWFGTPESIEERQTELDALYQQLFGDGREVKESQRGRPREVPPETRLLADQELIAKAKAAKNGDKFARLLAGDTSDYDGDDSCADAALCAMLAFWSDRDAGQMDRIFRSSGLMRPKWDERRGEKTYGEHTIEKACQITHETFRGGGRRSRPGAFSASGNAHLSISHQLKVPMVYKDFPLCYLPQPVQEYVKEAASALGVDPAFVALPALSACAAAIGNTRVIRLKRGWTEPAILWSTVVAESGSKKSPSIDAAVRPFYREQQRLLDEHKKAMAQYLNEKLSAKGTDKPAPEEPVSRRVLVSDTTIEKLGQILAQNPRGLLLKRDELSAWFGSFYRYKSSAGASDLPSWLELHHAGHLLIDRKTGEQKTLYIPRASVSIAGTIQPGVLRRCLTAEARESGLAARFLLAMPPKPQVVWSEAEISPEAEEQYERLFGKLFALGFRGSFGSSGTVHLDEPFVLQLDAAAKDRWKDFYNAWGRKQYEAEGDRAALLAKLEGAAARLALVHHVVTHAAADMDDRRPVSAESVNAGVKLVHWFAEEAERLYGILSETDGERGRRTLVELIQAHGGAITVRELMRASNRRFPDAATAESALNQLAEDRLGEWEDIKPAKDGRPRRAFRLFQQPEAKTIGADAAHDTCVTLAPEPSNSPKKNGECHAVTLSRRSPPPPVSPPNL